MKIKKSVLTIALLLVILASFIAGANAAGALEEISAYLNYGITIKYNGEAQIMTDAAGSRVYPISYNGTTYLPVRAISNILGVAVDWDQATKTVLLGEPAGGTDLIDSFKPYTEHVTTPGLRLSSNAPEFIQSSQKESAEVGGETISHWLKFWNISVNETYQNLTCSFNLGGKYSVLTFKVYSSKDCTLTIKGDNGSILGEYALEGGQVPQTITVNLLNTTQLTFVRNSVDTYTDTYIYGTVLK